MSKDAQDTGGTDAPAGTNTVADDAPANFGDGADALPLNAPPPSPSKDDAAEKDSAEKKSRDILRRLKKEAGDDVESDDALDDEELDEELDTDTEVDDAGTAEADNKPAGKGKGQPPDDEQATALAAAQEALIRDSWTLADLEKLPPERVLELGAKARQRQQAGDRFGSQKAQEIAQLKAKLAELEGTAPNNPAAAPQQQQQNPAQAAKPSADDPVIAGLKQKLSKLGELASPEAQAVIEEALTHVYTAASTGVQQQMVQQQQQLAAHMAAVERQMLTSARKSLVREFPAIKEDAKWADVQKKAVALAKTGYYGPGDLDSCVRDACKTLFTPALKDVQRKMLEKSKRAKEGQPDAGQQRSAQDAPKLTPEAISKRALQLMQKGKTPEQARRMALAGK
jgi:hypothetical protein